MKKFRSEKGSLVEHAIVCVPFCSILIATIAIVQLFNALGMVTLDSVASNMDSIARVNEFGTASQNLINSNQLFVGHQDGPTTTNAIANYSTENLHLPIRRAIANSAAGVSWLAHGIPFGIPTAPISYNAQGIRFVKILTSTGSTIPGIDDNAMVFLELQPVAFRLAGVHGGVVKAGILNPLVPATSAIVQTFGVTPNVGSFIEHNSNTLAPDDYRNNSGHGLNNLP